jgi:hypothetical protein
MTSVPTPEIIEEKRDALNGMSAVHFTCRGRVSETMPLVAARIPEYFEYISEIHMKGTRDPGDVEPSYAQVYTVTGKHHTRMARA